MSDRVCTPSLVLNNTQACYTRQAATLALLRALFFKALEVGSTALKCEEAVQQHSLHLGSS